MTAIKCKECSKEFRPESFGEWGSYCPYCALEVCEESQVQSVSEVSNDENDPENYCQKCSTTLGDTDKTHTLDSKTYCHPCIEAAGLAEFMTDDFRLEETVEFGSRETLLLSVKSFLFCATTLTAVFTGMFILINVAATIGGHPLELNLVEAVKSVLLFMLVSFCFSSLMSILVSFTDISNRKRTIRVENGMLHYGTSWVEKSIMLNEFRWKETNFGVDITGRVVPFQPVITILDDQQTRIISGYSERWRKIWSGYFTLVSVKEIRIPAYQVWVGKGLCHMLIGGTLGTLLGSAFKSMTGNPDWMVVFVLTGFFNAILYTVSILLISHISWTMKKDKSFTRIFATSIAFFGLGIQFGFYLGPLKGSFFAAMNGLLGWFVGRRINRMIIENEATVADTTRVSPPNSAVLVEARIEEGKTTIEHR